jgi:hypothetical protein
LKFLGGHHGGLVGENLLRQHAMRFRIGIDTGIFYNHAL